MAAAATHGGARRGDSAATRDATHLRRTAATRTRSTRAARTRSNRGGGHGAGALPELRGGALKRLGLSAYSQLDGSALASTVVLCALYSAAGCHTAIRVRRVGFALVRRCQRAHSTRWRWRRALVIQRSERAIAIRRCQRAQMTRRQQRALAAIEEVATELALCQSSAAARSSDSA